MEPPSTSPYISYILRLWQAGDGDQPQWCAALIETQSGERHCFASLEVMTIFLQTRMDTLTCPEAEGTNQTLQRSGSRADIPIGGVWSLPYLAVCCR
jgi:hypothetical protein